MKRQYNERIKKRLLQILLGALRVKEVLDNV